MSASKKTKQLTTGEARAKLNRAKAALAATPEAEAVRAANRELDAAYARAYKAQKKRTTLPKGFGE